MFFYASLEAVGEKVGDFFSNVLQLKEVATNQNQAKTNIKQTFEFSEKIRKYALA